MKSRIVSVVNAINSSSKGSAEAKPDVELIEGSMSTPLMTDEEDDFCSAAQDVEGSSTSPESQKEAVKRKFKSVIGTMKAKTPTKTDATRVKEKLTKIGAGTIGDARCAISYGAGTVRSAREHLEVALRGKAADPECIQALAAIGFREAEIERAVRDLGTEDVADLDRYLRRTEDFNDIARQKLLAMGFAQADVEKAIQRTGAHNLELIVCKLCKLQDKRELKAAAQVRRKDDAKRLALALQLKCQSMVTREDLQLSGKLSQCVSGCNEQLAECMRVADTFQARKLEPEEDANLPSPPVPMSHVLPPAVITA